MNKTCFFIGHRDTPDGLLPSLIATVEQHIAEYRVGEFVVGHYGNFDALAARAVKEVKHHYSDVRLTLLLPYHPGERTIELPDGFDGSFYPPMERVPKRLAIVRANRWMVDHSNYLIAYTWHPASHARELVEYAQKRTERGLIHVTQLPRHIP